MLDRLTGKPIHLYLLVLSCSLIAAGLPLNKVLMSLGTMLGVLNLLLEGNFRLYWENLKKNRLAWALWAYILFEWLSLAWTQNMDYALHDIRVKLPLYAIPLFLIARPIVDKGIIHTISGIFLLSLLVTSVINVGSYQHWWGNRSYDDIRGMSLFGSHIRYALMVVMGIVLACTWFCKQLPFRWAAFPIILWLIAYTWISQVLSGYLALGVVAVIATAYGVYAIRLKAIRLTLIGAAVGSITLLAFFVIRFLQPIPHKVDLHGLPRYTAGGSWYWHDTINPEWENGYPIVAFISQEELAPAWNKVSAIDYWKGTDKKHRPIRITLWRYMTSLGLTKDAAGFQKMTPLDIQHVENGIASIRLAGTGIKARLDGLQHQLEHRSDPNGHSLLQRLEYWKAGCSIIAENRWLGVGAGDVQDAFNRYYDLHHTNLQEDLRHRAHNQYMTSWITSGIGGFLAFLIWWLVTLRFGWRQKDFVLLSFAAITMSSFLIEDTIETQAGVTFVAFFYGLLISRRFRSASKEQT